MWEKVAEFLVVASAFFLAPFVTPEPPVVIEQTPVVEEEVQSEVVPVAVPEEPKPTEPIAPVKVVDPYCTQYAFRYSAEKYQSESKRPDEVRKDCYKQSKSNGDSDSIEELADENKDCPNKIKKAEKELKEWKKKYEDYKVRCP